MSTYLLRDPQTVEPQTPSAGGARTRGVTLKCWYEAGPRGWR